MAGQGLRCQLLVNAPNVNPRRKMGGGFKVWLQQ